MYFNKGIQISIFYYLNRMDLAYNRAGVTFQYWNWWHVEIKDFDLLITRV